MNCQYIENPTPICKPPPEQHIQHQYRTKQYLVAYCRASSNESNFRLSSLTENPICFSRCRASHCVLTNCGDVSNPAEYEHVLIQRAYLSRQEFTCEILYNRKINEGSESAQSCGAFQDDATIIPNKSIKKLKLEKMAGVAFYLKQYLPMKQ